MKCRVLVTADNAKMPGFVHKQCAAPNLSLACCATLYTYIDAISITKPHALALCVRFAEVRHLALPGSSMVRGDRDPLHMSQEQAQKASLACCATLTTYNNAIWMTKPHAHTLCVRFTEVNQLSNALQSTTKVTTTRTVQISMFDEVKLSHTAIR